MRKRNKSARRKLARLGSVILRPPGSVPYKLTPRQIEDIEDPEYRVRTTCAAGHSGTVLFICGRREYPYFFCAEHAHAARLDPDPAKRCCRPLTRLESIRLEKREQPAPGLDPKKRTLKKREGGPGPFAEPRMGSWGTCAAGHETMIEYVCPVSKKPYCRSHIHSDGCCRPIGESDLQTIIDVQDEEWLDRHWRVPHQRALTRKDKADEKSRRITSIWRSGRRKEDVTEEAEKYTASADEEKKGPSVKKGKGILCYHGSAGGSDQHHTGATYMCDSWGAHDPHFYCKKHRDHAKGDVCCQKVPRKKLAWAQKKSWDYYDDWHESESGWDDKDDDRELSFEEEKLPAVKFVRGAR